MGQCMGTDGMRQAAGERVEEVAEDEPEADGTKLDAPGGKFVVVKYDITEGHENPEKRGAEIEIRFYPDKACGTCKVGLIQVCEAAVTYDGVEWKNYFTSVGQKDNENLLVTTDHCFVDANSPDMDFSNKSPVFELYCERGKPQSSKDRDRGRLGTGSPKRSAIIVDGPTRSFEEGMTEIIHHFESAAIVLDGELKGACLGVLRWGYTVKGDGKVKLVKLSVDDHVSESWQNAAELWNGVRRTKIPEVKRYGS